MDSNFVFLECNLKIVYQFINSFVTLFYIVFYFNIIKHAVIILQNVFFFFRLQKRRQSKMVFYTCHHVLICGYPFFFEQLSWLSF